MSGSIFNSAYRRSYASEYIGEYLYSKRVTFQKNRHQPDYVKLFSLNGEVTKTTKPEKRIVVDFIPYSCWKINKTILGKPKQLGEGSFGHVYKGTIIPTKEVVALKVIEHNPREIKMAANEAKIMKLLEDTHYAPKCHGVAKDKDNRPVIAMEYIQNSVELFELLNSRKPISPRQRVLLAYKITDALHEFHKRKVLHNDLKTDNIMVDFSKPDDPKVTIIDFGQASYNRGIGYGVIDPVDQDSHLAPEVRQGNLTNAKSDIYSLGILFDDMIGNYNTNPELSALSKECTRNCAHNRPTLQYVLKYLKSRVDHFRRG